MSTPQQIGGYTYRQQCVRAHNADRTALLFVCRLFDERPSPALAATYLARIGLALGEIADAIGELERIGQSASAQRSNRSE
jgi:hypothetical protein